MGKKNNPHLIDFCDRGLVCLPRADESPRLARVCGPAVWSLLVGAVMADDGATRQKKTASLVES